MQDAKPIPMFKSFEELAHFTIRDVVEYDDWAVCVQYDVNNVTLHAVSANHVDELLKASGRRVFEQGEVVFFLSKDRLRARCIICMSGNPRLLAVANLVFGKLSPELVIAQWLGQRLRKSTDAALAAHIEQLGTKGAKDLVDEMGGPHAVVKLLRKHGA